MHPPRLTLLFVFYRAPLTNVKRQFIQCILIHTHRVSNWEVWRLTEQPLLTLIIQKRRLMLFGHLTRMDASADARRIVTAVPQSVWRRPVGRPHSWMATLKNDLSLHNLTYEDAIELALDKLLWGLLAASGSYALMVHAE